MDNIRKIIILINVLFFSSFGHTDDPITKISYLHDKTVNSFGGWALKFSGANLSASDFTPLFHHQKRPSYTPWRKHPSIDDDLLQKDLKSLSRALELKGYYKHQIEANWKQPKKGKATMNVSAELGQPFLIESIVIEAIHDDHELPTPLSLPDALLSLKEGEIFSEEQFQNTINQIKEDYLNKGHYWVEVQPKVQASKTSQKCAVRLRVIPGPICEIGPIKVMANSTIQRRLIFREFLLRPGDTFSPKAIIDTRKALIRTRWFRLVTMKVDKDTPKGSPILPLVLELEDAEHRSIKLGVGFGSEEGPRFKGGWTHRHFLRRGWKQSIENKISSDDMSLKLALDIPRAIRHSGHLRYEFEIGKDEEEDYDFDKTLLSTKWTYSLSERQNLHFEMRLKHLAIDADPSLSATLGNLPYLALMTGPRILIDRKWTSQNNPFQLSSNHSLGALFDIKSKGAGLWKTLHGYQFSFPLIFNWGLFHQSRLGWIGEVPGQVTPLPERFYAGGAGSVRGYERRILGPRNIAGDRLGGLSLAESSFELRHSLFTDELVYALFWDLGQLDLKIGGLQSSGFRTAWGMGIGYKMEIGLMRLDVGVPNARREWESPFQVHIDFGVGL